MEANQISNVDYQVHFGSPPMKPMAVVSVTGYRGQAIRAAANGLTGLEAVLNAFQRAIGRAPTSHEIVDLRTKYAALSG